MFSIDTKIKTIFGIAIETWEESLIKQSKFETNRYFHSCSAVQ
jgi:hypothetical protein